MTAKDKSKTRYLLCVLLALFILLTAGILLAKTEAECLDLLVKKVGTTDQKLVELFVYCGVKVMEGDKMYFDRDVRAIEKRYPRTIVGKTETPELGVHEKRIINGILTKNMCDQLLIVEKAFLNECEAGK